MKFFEPVQGGGGQEVSDFEAAKIKDEGSPVGMFALARVGVFIECGAIELCEGVVVLGEMCGNPVEDDPESALVGFVDEGAEFIRGAEARGWCKLTGTLIAPRSAKRMFGDRQQFQVSKSEVNGIIDEGIRELEVTERPVVIVAPSGP